LPLETIYNPALDEDEGLLKVYGRRLIVADNKFRKSEPLRKRFVSRYENNLQEDQVTDEGHVVSVTSGIGVIDTMYASMTAVDVEFICRNAAHGTQLQALASTAGLNQAWRDSKGQKHAKDAVKDSLLVDIGWVKVYYDYKEAQGTMDVPAEALRKQIEEIAVKRNISYDDVPDEELNLTQNVDIVIRDRVCVDYVPWQLIRPDPTAKRIEDVRWVAQYTFMSPYEVKNHPVWKDFVHERYGEEKGDKLLKDLGGDTRVADYGDADLYREVEEDEFSDDLRCTVVEFWDFETGLVTTFPKGNSELVLFQRENPLMFNSDLEDRNPFKPLIIRKDNSQLEGLGDMRVIWPALEELDQYRNNLATHIERTIPKVIGPEDALTQAGKEALKSAEWGAFVGTNGVSGDAIQPLVPPPLPQEAFDVPEKIQAEMREGTGANEVMRGLFPGGRHTATEVQQVTDRGDMRQSERRSAMEEWYLAISKTMLQLMMLYYDQDRILRYTDDLGKDFEWAWSAQDIALDSDIEIAITPRENLTRDQRVQRFLLLMNLALPLQETDRYEFLKMAALEMGYRMDDVNRLVKNPAEVQAENQLAQAQAMGAAPQPGAPGLRLTPAAGGG